MISNEKDKTLKMSVMLTFCFWRKKSKVCSFMETYIQTYIASIEKFVHIFPPPKCHLKSDAELGKTENRMAS